LLAQSLLVKGKATILWDATVVIHTKDNVTADTSMIKSLLQTFKITPDGVLQKHA
jgi:hypothetical protein